MTQHPSEGPQLTRFLFSPLRVGQRVFDIKNKRTVTIATQSTEPPWHFRVLEYGETEVSADNLVPLGQLATRFIQNFIPYVADGSSANRRTDA